LNEKTIKKKVFDWYFDWTWDFYKILKCIIRYIIPYTFLNSVELKKLFPQLIRFTMSIMSKTCTLGGVQVFIKFRISCPVRHFFEDLLGLKWQGNFETIPNMFGGAPSPSKTPTKTESVFTLYFTFSSNWPK
jgi:hypothetical protein